MLTRLPTRSTEDMCLLVWAHAGVRHFGLLELDCEVPRLGSDSSRTTPGPNLVAVSLLFLLPPTPAPCPHHPFNPHAPHAPDRKPAATWIQLVPLVRRPSAALENLVVPSSGHCPALPSSSFLCRMGHCSRFFFLKTPIPLAAHRGTLSGALPSAPRNCMPQASAVLDPLETTRLLWVTGTHPAPRTALTTDAPAAPKPPSLASLLDYRSVTPHTCRHLDRPENGPLITANMPPELNSASSFMAALLLNSPSCSGTPPSTQTAVQADSERSPRPPAFPNRLPQSATMSRGAPSCGIPAAIYFSRFIAPCLNHGDSLPYFFSSLPSLPQQPVLYPVAGVTFLVQHVTAGL